MDSSIHDFRRLQRSSWVNDNGLTTLIDVSSWMGDRLLQIKARYLEKQTVLIVGFDSSHR